ncbi:hypothetical protein HHI36_017343 [Cryptolaemus montrouzieri]|uniref:Uncharacterized protein n=1 Tax=Cryptolaemus montrouzieri TaxID=559131 RepID=A0ABD2NMA9_9CUCU
MSEFDSQLGHVLFGVNQYNTQKSVPKGADIAVGQRIPNSTPCFIVFTGRSYIERGESDRRNDTVDGQLKLNRKFNGKYYEGKNRQQIERYTPKRVNNLQK